MDDRLPTAFAGNERLSVEEMLGARWSSPKSSRLGAELGLRAGKERSGGDALGLSTVGDLVFHLPRRHLDRGDLRQVGDLRIGEDASVEIEVRRIETRRSWGRRAVTRTVAVVADGSGQLEATWFNQPWVERQLPVGSAAILHGRLEPRGGFRVVEHEAGGGGGTLTSGLVPVHPAADGLPPKRIRKLISLNRPAALDVVDPLGGRLIASRRLPTRADALDAIHFPTSAEAQELARRRLAFDELYLLQVDLRRRRAARRLAAAAPVLSTDGVLADRWLAGLPFSPTADQMRAIEVVDGDLSKPVPMSRLLMGDVGSGKTVVALHTMLRAVDSGFQALLMAPTETLAGQHARTVERLLDGLPIPFALLTGSTPRSVRNTIVERLAGGELQLLIGTHALLESDIEVPRLAVCVVDEQHRFGVRQRQALTERANGLVPHSLHMTATPIPRSLALAAYGDVDTVTLREMPAGRRPVETHLVSGDAARRRAYERIREEVASGGRAFVVCPLVEVSEAVDARAATEERDRLAAGQLKGLRLDLIHGRMRPAEKEEAMLRFASGESDVLVSTTVIEVGIDVPEATVILIEDAERFGLAQLHQLRGRVGRGERGGLCLLCGDGRSRRLQAMVESGDGFRLAELDLELRGEGDLTGLRQSGLPRLRAAELPRDVDLLEAAHLEAEALVDIDPGLDSAEGRLVAAALDRDRVGQATADGLIAA